MALILNVTLSHLAPPLYDSTGWLELELGTWELGKLSLFSSENKMRAMVPVEPQRREEDD